jgi:hypothetical protein
MNRPPTPTGSSLSERSSLRDADTAFLSGSELLRDGALASEETQREALDRIAAAARSLAPPARMRHLELAAVLTTPVRVCRLGDLDAFGRGGADKVHGELDRIRDLQVQIFQDHMRFDVFHESLEQELDFSSKEFLADFQKKHVAKEKDLVTITGALEQLGAKVREFNAESSSERMPVDPAGLRTLPSHRLTMKDAIGRVVQTKRTDHGKTQVGCCSPCRFCRQGRGLTRRGVQQRVIDAAKDAVTMVRITGSLPNVEGAAGGAAPGAGE